MQYLTKFIIGLLFLCGVEAKTQTTIHIKSVPKTTQASDTLYLAGSNNGWNPADVNSRFSRNIMGEYWLTVDTNGIEMEYKITRGSWEKVECHADSSFFENRHIESISSDTIHIAVEEWEDKLGSKVISSTANAQVSIFDSAMHMPQLDRYRRIWVYLPQDYSTSNKSYPVMYMQDGQNVFDASTAYAGEWHVDETLTDLENRGIETAIVVAIDNGGEHRINEYLTYVHEEYGGGEGEAYLQFIVETLKPKIDNNFRTLPDAKSTAVFGSSAGGLISHYAHFKYPNVFGKLGAFSPSYWISSEYFTYTAERVNPKSSKIYMLAGMQEAGIARYTLKMDSLLQNNGYTDKSLHIITPDDGEHAEWFWAREFEAAFLWLFDEE